MEEQKVNRNEKSGIGKIVGTALTWAAVLCLGIWVIGWLLGRRWGALLIVSALFTVGWFLILALVIGTLELDPDCEWAGTLVGASVFLGFISALAMFRHEEQKNKQRDRELMAEVREKMQAERKGDRARKAAIARRVRKSIGEG